MKKSFFGEIVRGIWRENPIFVIMLGLCPTLAVTTSLKNGVGMAAAATFVLIFSNLIISLLRRVIPEGVRIPCFIVVIATFVTIVDLVMSAYLPDLHKALGIFIPLIVVNCIILGRAEAFASKNKPVYSVADGIGIGLGFLLALVIISGIREVTGSGELWGYPLAHWERLKPWFQPALVMTQPVGAFLLIGLLLGLFKWARMGKEERAKRAAFVRQRAIADELAREAAERAAKKKQKKQGSENSSQ